MAQRALAGLTEDRLYVCDDHLLDLWLSADPALTRRLAERVLRPLAGETPTSRAKLEATLAAFLDHHGHQGAMASALGLHQQTVRYRLGRLRDAFGPALDEPRDRLALRVALLGSAPLADPAVS
jgi:DNA-binding PucR family transcriptional regulator